MIKSDVIINKLDKLFSEELQDVVIFRTQDGIYDLYGNYTIVKQYDKTYLVTLKYSFTQLSFYSIKNAVAWCINDKRNKILCAKRILELDNKLQSIDSAIDLHKHLLRKSKDDDGRLIYYSKLSDEKVKKYEIVKELTEYINESNNWQQKRFDHQFQ